MSITDKIKKLRCCVIIPTYNNEKTLKRVIDGVLKYTDSVIVVNDGSTDSTFQILENYPKIEQIHLPKNKGKGNALRKGFLNAEKIGYEYAIAIDSDGQHFPEDLEVFINEYEKNGEALLIGSRNMKQEGVPGKSSFGNKFSNFWFWVETGIKLKDTQSGYRFYPLKKVNSIKFYTSKFEFEIEVIVKSAWRGVPVKNVPVKVLYDESERVSHFRPFKDFTRISILNTWLVLVTFLYIKPRDFFRSFKKKGVKRFFLEDLLKSTDSPKKKAFSVALGVFIGVAPLWGLQTILAIFLAAVLRLNKFIAFAFSNISIPPMIPVIIYLSLKTGAIILRKNNVPVLNLDTFKSLGDFKEHLSQYLIGSIVLATLLAFIFGIITYIVLSLSKQKSQNSIL